VRIWIVMLHVFLGVFNMKTQQSAILIAAAASAALCISKHIIMIMTGL
jgi:hypothetical protein